MCASVSRSRLPVTRARATDATAPSRHCWAAVAGVPMVRAGLCSRGRVTPDEGAAASTWALEIRITVVFLSGQRGRTCIDCWTRRFPLSGRRYWLVASLFWQSSRGRQRTAWHGLHLAARLNTLWPGLAPRQSSAWRRERRRCSSRGSFFLLSMPPSWNAASFMPQAVRPPCRTSRSVSAACCWAVPWSTWRADVG